MTEVKPNVLQTVPLFGVRDIHKSLTFYVDGLGFTKTKDWMPSGRLRWCWLELDNVALMLQEFWAEGDHANVPDSKVGVGVSLNFTCEDALLIYHEITSRGVAAQRPFVGNGMWVTGVTDPDGYELYFQSPTDVPEEMVFAE